MNEQKMNAKDQAEWRALSLWLADAQVRGLDALGGTWPERNRKYRRYLALSRRGFKKARRKPSEHNLGNQEVA